MSIRSGSKRKDDSDIQFKVIIIGDSGVGKSCFLARYIKGVFIEEHHVTLGKDVITIRCLILNKNCRN